MERDGDKVKDTAEGLAYNIRAMGDLKGINPKVKKMELQMEDMEIKLAELILRLN